MTLHCVTQAEWNAALEYCASEGIETLWKQQSGSPSGVKWFYLSFTKPLLPRHVYELGKAMDKAREDWNEFVEYLNRDSIEDE